MQNPPSAARDAAMILEPNTVVDRYTVEKVLGEGGMAVVYKVRHNRLGTHHAMKVLKITQISVRDRMVREGQVQAKLRHPNVVSVTDVIEVDDVPALVMEYIDGSDLGALIDDRRLDLDQVDVLARGIIAGVSAAHQHGLVHRDLKPTNILLAVESRSLVPKITDFGLAKVLSSDATPGQTDGGQMLGTPSYMSPEQILSAKDVDARSDIFSLGAILYELITSKRAYGGAEVVQIHDAIQNARRVPIDALRPETPARMIEAVQGALLVNRNERIPDCDTLLRIWTGEVASNTMGPFDAELFERVRQMGAGIARPEEQVGTLEEDGPSIPERDTDTFYDEQVDITGNMKSPALEFAGMGEIDDLDDGFEDEISNAPTARLPKYQERQLERALMGNPSGSNPPPEDAPSSGRASPAKPAGPPRAQRPAEPSPPRPPPKKASPPAKVEPAPVAGARGGAAKGDPETDRGIRAARVLATEENPRTGRRWLWWGVVLLLFFIGASLLASLAAVVAVMAGLWT